VSSNPLESWFAAVPGFGRDSCTLFRGKKSRAVT
jgi:hypothetical protein